MHALTLIALLILMCFGCGSDPFVAGSGDASGGAGSGGSAASPDAAAGSGGSAGQDAGSEAGASAGGSAGSSAAGSAGSLMGGSAGIAGTAGSGGQAGQSGSSGSAGSAGTCGSCGALEQCSNGLCAALLVAVNGGYSIDATEVTRSQYEAWLATQPVPLSDPKCAWKTSFAADASCMGQTEVCNGACDKHPVVCVDWCGAYAYCKAVGKRLCGKIGGGTNLFTDVQDASKSQWYRACTSGGQLAYPYGNSFQPTTCNGAGSGTWTTAPVGSFASCSTTIPGYSGVYDLSGNAWEWEDSCAGSAKTSLCNVRGGDFADTEHALSCATLGGSALARDVGDPSTGFRCCAN